MALTCSTKRKYVYRYLIDDIAEICSTRGKLVAMVKMDHKYIIEDLIHQFNRMGYKVRNRSVTVTDLMRSNSIRYKKGIKFKESSFIQNENN